MKVRILHLPLDLSPQISGWPQLHFKDDGAGPWPRPGPRHCCGAAQGKQVEEKVHHRCKSHTGGKQPWLCWLYNKYLPKMIIALMRSTEGMLSCLNLGFPFIRFFPDTSHIISSRYINSQHIFKHKYHTSALSVKKKNIFIVLTFPLANLKHA